ncbi:Ig-like domain-containing protein, partial [Chengkuizengella axinellae]
MIFSNRQKNKFVSCVLILSMLLMSFLPNISIVFAEDSDTIETPIIEDEDSTIEEEAVDSQPLDGKIDGEGEVEDQSNALVRASEEIITENDPFELNINEAIDQDGELLNGPILIIVTSDIEGNLHSEPIEFVEGSATIPIILTTIESHIITVNVDGMTEEKRIDVTVISSVIDLSGVSIIAGNENPAVGEEFSIEITEAMDEDGIQLEGEIGITVISDDLSEGKEGEIYNDAITFSEGSAVVEITLNNERNQALTIKIEGITNENIVDVNVVEKEILENLLPVSKMLANPVESKPKQVITSVKADFSETDRFDFTGKKYTPEAVDDDNDPNSPPILRLTEDQAQQAGSAFIENKIFIKNGDSFSTYFTFKIEDTSNNGADGLAFVIQPISSGELNDGGGIGYAEINRGLGDGTDENDAILKSLAVEFDTHNNDQWVRPNDLGELESNNHIGINVGGHIRSVAVVDENSIDFNGGSVVHVWIDYGENSNNTIEVRIAESNSRPDSAVVSYNFDNLTQYSFDDDGSINLGENFDLSGNFEGDIHNDGVTLSDIIGGDQAFIGFTAATGGLYEAHYITSWYFDNKYNPIDTDENEYEQAPTIDITNVTKLRDNKFEITATVTAKDEDGNPYVVEGENVTFRTNLGDVAPNNITTDENGEAVTILASNEIGFATITAILDSGDTDETVVQIVSIPSNTEPTVSNIEKTGSEGQTIPFTSTDFSDEFQDVDNGDSLVRVKLISLPEKGTLMLDGNEVIIADGSDGYEIEVDDLKLLTFVSAENWNGELEFTWNGSDGTAYAENPATVSITINPVNSKPVADEQTVITNEGESIEIILTGNDDETDSSDLVFNVDENSVQNGTITVEG